MRRYRFLNLGAGVQSTRLALEFDAGEVLGPDREPIKIDAAYMGDTGDEPAAVYRHLDWLIKRITAYPVYIVSIGRLSEHLRNGVNSTGQRAASIPAFTFDGEKVGQVQRQCSKEYKIAPIEKAIREFVGCEAGRPLPKGVEVIQYLGISLDETGRACRVMRNRVPKALRAQAERWNYSRLQEYQKGRQWQFGFPLVDRGQTRSDCVTYNATRVPHPVPRSACVFCPYHDDLEWDAIRREAPYEWEFACQVDEALRADGVVFQSGHQCTHVPAPIL